MKLRCASPPAGFGSPLDNCLIGVGIVFITVGFFSHTGRGRRDLKDLNSLFHWSHSAVPLAVDEPA